MIICSICGADLTDAEDYDHVFVDDFGFRHITYAKICYTNSKNYEKHCAEYKACTKIIQPYLKKVGEINE